MTAASAGPRPGWTGALLVGGKSRRMGQDKLLLPLGAGRLVDRPAEVLRRRCPELICAGRELGLAGFRFVPDPVPDSGPLAGLVAALEAARSDWLLALAGDLPGVTAEFLLELQERAERHPEQALIPELDGRAEPLVAAWPVSAAGPLRAALEQGRRSLHRAAECLPRRRWALPDSAKMRAIQRNLNAPDDWRAFTGGEPPREDPDRA